MTILVAIAATQVGHLRRVGISLVVEPEGEGGGFTTEQLIDRLAQPVIGVEASNGDEALRQITQAMVAVGFPDPVRGGFSYGSKALFAGLQRQVTGLEALQGAVDFLRGAQGVAEEVDHQQAQHQHRAEQRWHYPPEQLITRARRQPFQTVAGIAQGQAGCIGRQFANFLNVHAAQACAGAQVDQLFRR
ncbi:hypothetical protein D3C79_736590 [compost metagenome]